MNAVTRGVMNKFNRGEVGEAALAREDVSRIDNSCSSMINFLPQRLGPMRYRPGAGLVDLSVDTEAILVPFVTEIADPLVIILGVGGGSPTLKMLRNDAYIARTSVTSSMQNQLFGTGFTAGEWVDISDTPATAVISGGELILTGSGLQAGKAYQTLDSTQTGATHGFKIRVTEGNVNCQIGITGQESAELFDQTLGIGEYHIEVTPSSACTVTFSNSNRYRGKVTSCELLGAVDTVTLIEDALDATFLTTGELTKLRTLRYAQSADVVYFASKYFLPFIIKRFSDTSYGIERYVNVYGPYDFINSSDITMNPTAPLDGNMQVISSAKYFDTTKTFGFDKGTLLKMAVIGQAETVVVTVTDEVTGGIYVFGSGAARNLDIDVTVNSGSGWTVILEKSFDEITWQAVPGESYTTAQNKTYDDQLDGAEIFYRLKLTVAGTANLTLSLDYSYGTVEAEGRITSRSNSTTIDIAWYTTLNQDQTVRDWYIGSWGGKRNFPSSVAFHEGRLWFAGGNRIWGSESDFYTSFDRFLAGASASIQRTIGFGAAEEILWLAPSARLVAGTAISEIDIKSTAFGEVLTDLNTNLKIGSDLGCADTAPLVLDQEVIFVQRGGDKLIGLEFSMSQEKHAIVDFNMLNPDVLTAGVVRMAYSRNPETRIYIVMDDGTMRVLLRDATEGVLGWSRITVQRHDGASIVTHNITDVAVIPGTTEDSVYVSTDQGQLLKFALTTEAAGENLSKHFDSYQVFTSPGTTIQLSTNAFSSGETVGVWVDGVDDGDYVVDGSTQITSVTSGTDVVVGYRYVADYITSRLTEYDDLSVLASRKRILNTGLIMKSYVPGVLQVGPSVALLGNMPLLEDNQAPVKGNYDFFPFEYAGVSETDPRIFLRALGPCDIMAMVFDIKNTSHRTKAAEASA
jgi:hypothetical protein